MDETKKYKVIVSDSARDMLVRHLAFLSNVSQNAAEKTKQKILKALNSLTFMPHRYPFFNEPYIPPDIYHKMYIEKWFLVLYQIKGDTVYVDYILDCRQDHNWLQ